MQRKVITTEARSWIIFYFIFSLSLTFLQLKADIIRSNESGGGNWNQTSTWQGSTIPSSVDTVVIASGDAVVLDISTTIARLVLESGSSANTLTHQSTEILTVNGDVILNTPAVNGLEQRWNINSGAAQVVGNVRLNIGSGVGNGTRVATINISSGSLSADSLIYLNASGLDSQTRILITAAGSIDLEGSIELGSSNGTLDCGSEGRVYFTGASTQMIRQTGSGLIYYHDVYIQGDNSRSVFLDANVDQVGNGRINGSLFIENGTLNARTYYITLASGETFAVRHGATFITQAANPNAFPSAGTVSLDSTSTVIYNYNGSQTISPQTYGNLSVISPNTATRTYTLGGNIIVQGNLLVQQTGGFLAILEMATYSITANHSDSLIMDANTRLDLSGASNFPNRFGFFELNLTSEVQYEATSLDQTIAVSSQTTGETINYGRLDLRGGQTSGLAKIIGGSLKVMGDLDVGSGGPNVNLNLGDSTHFIAGNWNDDGGSVINYAQSTVDFNGSNQNIARANFYNVIFSGTAIKTITYSFNAENDVTIENGVTVDPNSVQMTVAGDWQNNGSFTPDAGQNTIFDGADQTISASHFADLFSSGSGQKTANGRLLISDELEINSNLLALEVLSIGGILDVNGILNTEDSTIIQGNVDIASTATFNAGGPIDANGVFDINNGTFSAGSYNHHCAGNWIQDGLATIDRGTSLWIFDGANQSITRGLFYDAEFSGTGTKTLLTNFDFDRHITIHDAVAVSSGASGTLAGDLQVNGSGYLSSTGSITLDGANQAIGPLTILNLIFSGTGTKTATGNFDINGSVTINSAFNAGSYSHTVAGNWSGAGTFTASTSTITFDAGDSDILRDNIFYNLTLNSSGGDAALDNGTAANPTRITVNNNFNIINGEFRVQGLSGTELSVGGNITIENNPNTGIQFNAADITFEIGGDFRNLNNLGGINDGLTSLDGTEIFIFNGSGNSQLQTSNVDLPSVTLDKFNGSLTLNDTLTITRKLTLTAGNLNSSNTNILFLNPPVTIVGGSDNSFVNGPLIQVASTAGTKLYPLGKSSSYRPLEFYFSAVSNSPALKVDLFSGSPGGSTDTTILDTISSIRYYQTEVINSGLINSATIKINFGSDDGVSDLENMVIAHSTTQNGLFTSIGQSASDGSPSIGSITSDPYNINEAGDFFLLGFLKVSPIKLKITEILPNPIVVGEDFQITVQAQTRTGTPADVITDTDIQLTRILTGTGSLSGLTSGTILAGQNQVIINGIQYGIAENLQIEASRSSGDILKSDTSEIILATNAFYSNLNENGNPAINTNWNSQRDGSGSPPAAGAFSGLFIIQAQDTMRTAAAFSEYDLTLRIENQGAFFNNVGITELGSLIIEDGGLTQANTEIEISSGGSFSIYNGGTYIHNNTARLDEAEALFAGSEDFRETSQFTALQLSIVASSLNTFARASYGNLTLNLTLNTALFSFDGNFTAVKGDLIIQSTGTGRIEFADTDSENYTLNIDGDFRIMGGNIYLMDANALSTINIAGNLVISGGELRVTDGTGDPIVNIGGDLLISGGTLNHSAVTGGLSTINLSGGLNHTAGTISETAGGAGTIVFSGSEAQTWTAGGILSGNAVNFTLNNNSGLTLSGNDVQLSGTLTLSNGLLTTATAAMIIVGTNGLISGGNSTSFINGPMAYSWSTTTATKIFPIGAETDYRPLELTLINPSSPVVKAQMFNSPSNGTPDNSTLVKISQARYYQTSILSGSLSSNSARVKLTWGNDDGVADLPSLVLGRSTEENGIFSSLGQSAVSGDSLNGNITSQNFTLTANPGNDFLVLGTTNSDVPLPVTLTIFEALPVDYQIHIWWRTESEVNNSHWIIERAVLADSSEILLPASQISFQTLTQLDGEGNFSGASDYQFIDADILPGNWYRYRLKDVSFNGQITVHPDVAVRANLPNQFKLWPNYPNPFNPETTIKYELSAAAQVNISVYNAIGQKIATVVDARQKIGVYQVKFNGSDLTSGLYFYKIQAGNFVQTKKMLLVK